MDLQKVTFSRKSYFPGSRIPLEVAFSRNSHFPGSHISLEVTFPRKSYFPGSHISGRSQLLGSHISREVTFPGKSHFPAFQKCYYFIDDRLTWDQANAKCGNLSAGATLTSIGSKNENNFINSIISTVSRPYVWVGGTDAIVEGTWR